MKNKRKLIRDSIKQSIENKIHHVPVFFVHSPDMTGFDRCITISMGDGDIDYDGVYKRIQVQIFIGVHLSGVDDQDALDSFMDEVDESIVGLDIPGIVGIIDIGFDYDENQENQFSSLYNQYLIHYT